MIIEPIEIKRLREELRIANEARVLMRLHARIGAGRGNR